MSLNDRQPYSHFAQSMTLKEFKAAMENAIARGDKDRLYELQNYFKVCDDGAFRLHGGKTNTGGNIE